MNMATKISAKLLIIVGLFGYGIAASAGTVEGTTVTKHKTNLDDTTTTNPLGTEATLEYGGFLFNSYQGRTDDSRIPSGWTKVYFSAGAEGNFSIYKNTSDVNKCLIAFRGTSDRRDMVDDLRSQTHSAVSLNLPFSNFNIRRSVRDLWSERGQTLVSAAFQSRTHDVYRFANSNLTRLACHRYEAIGHSLGGSITSLYALYHLMDNRRNNGTSTLTRTIAFNAPKTGNYESLQLSALVSEFSGHTLIQMCRNGDPVRMVPLKIAKFYRLNSELNSADYFRGCSYMAPSRSTWNGAANHSSDRWAQRPGEADEFLPENMDGADRDEHWFVEL